MTWTDTQVGLLLNRLAERGLDRNTLVMVISDNGPHGEGADYGHVGSHLPHSVRFFDSNGPLQGKKRSLHEGGIRIPMIARLPETVRTADSPAPAPSSAPRSRCGTCCPPSRTWPGHGSPAGSTASPSRRPCAVCANGATHFYWQHRGERFGEAVRFGKWKAMRYDRGRVRLYRLDRDLGEVHDVAGRHPAVARRAARLMRDAVS